MELYFLRHGPAGSREEWTGDDCQRPLTEEGACRMAREAETLDALGVRPDWILSSPLARALRTAEIVARGLALENRLVIDEGLASGFDAPALDRILQAYAGSPALMLVGHEPDFSAAIGRLTGGRVVCRKGGLARIDLADPPKPKGILVWLLPPKVLAL